MILFLIAFLCAVFASACFLKETLQKQEKYPQLEKVLRIVSRCIAGALLIPAYLDIFSLVDFRAFHSAYFFMALFVLLEWLLCVQHKKHPSSVLKFSAKAVLVVLVLELTLFQAPTYRLCFGDYPKSELQLSDALLEGNGTRNDDGTITVSGETEMVLTFTGTQQEVGTIDTDVSFAAGGKEALLKVDITDATQSKDYRYDIVQKNLVSKRAKSDFTACNFSGAVEAMRIKLTPVDDATITLNSVTLNQTMPIDISIPRVLLLLLIPIFIYAVMNAPVLQKGFSENRKFSRNAAIVITVGFCLIVFFSMGYKLGDAGWSHEFQLTKGNQMTQELVDAFENKQVHLLEEPSAELNALENPYDKNARDSSGAYVLWDHVYYNHHYYSYYGIAPVVLLFLPYHLITGYYFSSTVAVLLFSWIGMAGLSMVFFAFLKKWFPKLPTGIALTCLLLLQIISGIWFSIGRPNFYEAAISAGFACLTWGAFFLIRSNVIGSGKISFWRTAVASFLLALSVLCRPTLAVYCVCAAVFLLMAAFRFRKGHELAQGQTFAKNGVRYLVCAFLPMLCLAGVQMWYNYARFGSPFDFGIQYSLTINDFTKSQYHTGFVWEALYNYLFNIPVFSAKYPFIHAEFQDMNVNGFFHNDFLSTANTSGLFTLALPVFAYLLAGKAWKQLPNRTARAQSLAYIGLPCVLMPIIIIASVWESGYAVRYMLDFSWEAVLGAFAIIFFLYQKTDNALVQKIIKGLLCFAMVWALVVSGLQCVNQMFRYTKFHYEYPEIAYSIEQMIAFWE